MLNARSELSDSDYDCLVEYFKQDAGLAPINAKRPLLELSNPEAVEAGSATCRLDRIFDLKNVNALAEGQQLGFGPNLTLVYGNNGAGKTGYTRPLGCVGYTHGERDVLPDATRSDPDVLPSAKFEISFGPVTQQLSWTNGDRPSELSRLRVFDENSAVAYLSQANPLGFVPTGLSRLTRLADATDEVRSRVRKIIDEFDVPHRLTDLFAGSSEIKTIVDDIDINTRVEDLRKLGSLTPEENNEIANLAVEIAELKREDVAKLLERKLLQKSDMERLLNAVEVATRALDEQTESDVYKIIEDIFRQRRAVAEAGATRFLSDSLKQAGKPVWIEFVSAAKALADAERMEKYPTVGAPCLLCQQPLSAGAVELIEKLWQFLNDDTKSKLEQMEGKLAEKIEELEYLSLDYFRSDSSIQRLLTSALPTSVQALEAHVESCVDRRREMVRSLRTLEISKYPGLIKFELADLQHLLDITSEEIEGLKQSDNATRIATKEARLRYLEHRRLLGERLRDCESYIGRVKWAKRAGESLGSTRAITSKYNDMFDRLVTKKYVNFFESTLQKFKSDLQLSVEAHGSKGETVRQIILSPKAYRHFYSLEDVLSDGEKRAVAVSDFIAEAALDESRNAVILDDPTTFFDDRWKGTLAECLAELARDRQVVVFTHDLPFLYKLKESAEIMGVDVKSHWIRSEDGKPGFIYLDNGPVCEKEFRNGALAREYYSKSKSAPPGEQQSLLQQGFGALRTSYEALIIFDLFAEVVARFEERISFGRLSDVCLDRSIFLDIVSRMEALSRHIDAHLHSDKFVSEKPSPADLLHEIEMFDGIRRRIKNFKNAQSST